MNTRKRSTEEYIILSISGASALCVAPFFFIRVYYSDWAIALWDLFAVLSTSCLFFYVYRTSKILYAKWILASLCILVVIGTIVLKGAQQVVWIYPSLIGLFFLLKPKLALSISALLILGLGMFLWEQLNYILLVQYALSTTITLMFSYAFADRMLRQQGMLRELSTKDPLTGAGNRRAMEEMLLNTAKEGELKNNALPCLILIDLDEFKKINDRYGHSAGDNILRDFAHITSQILMEKDQLYRFGGEEFVIISQHRNQESTSILAEEIREAIDNHRFDQNLHVTISLGIAEYKTGETGLEWLGRADNAMYRAKDAGRNLCCIAA